LPKNYLRDVHKYGNFFPLKLSLIKNKAYYVSNYGNFEPSIALGSEIVSINNVPTEDILSELLVFIPSEGTNSTTKRNELNHNFNAYYYLLDSSKIFEVEFKISETENKIIAVPACSFNEFIAPSQSKASNLPITFTIDTINDIGLLKIKSFEIPDINGYIKKMDSVFQLLENKNIENLVIDLRDNKGGHPIFAAQLFSYFAATEFTYFKQNPKVPDFEPLYNPMQPSKYNFKGKTYVFINGACLSTTGHLISLIQYHTKAIFIGEEPGSSFYCNDQSTQIVLPNTRIEVTIPRTTFETATTGYTKGKPFNVDYKVNSSLSDILNGKDTYMEFLNELIEK